MATSRIVSTNFWKDTYIIELDPIEKLLFMYFITNPRTTLAGIYEISMREAAFDTGIDRDMVVKIMARFCRENKMHYENGWLILRNFTKHQRSNPSVKKGIKRALSELPQWLQTKSFEIETEGEQISLFLEEFILLEDRLGTDSPQSATTKPNLTKPNLTKDTTNVVPAEPASYGNPKVNELFEYWELKTQLPIKSRIASNRKSASILLNMHGMQKVKQLIDGVALTLEERYAPTITDFNQLKDKQMELIAWGRKRNQSSGVEVI